MADDLLPANATAFEKAESDTSAIILDVPADDIRLMRRAGTVPAKFLPYLAWERSVDVWDPQWSEQQKRATIAASFEVHQHKGTRHALDLALGALGIALTTKEWFEYGGGAYRFKIIVGLDEVNVYTQRQHALIVRTAFSAKNTRSYLEQVNLQRVATPAPLYVGAAIICKLKPRHDYDPLSAIAVRGLVFVGAAAFARTSIRLQ